MGATVRITIDDSELVKLIEDTKGPVKPAIVADGVEYGIWQELGVQNGFGRGIVIPAHPFMTPAVEDVRPGFEKAFDGQITTKQAQAVVNKAAYDVERGAKIYAPVDTGALRNSIHVVLGATTSLEFETERAISGREAARRGLEIVE